jgi:nucleotide-binding universal stress UspA family protein
MTRLLACIDSSIYTNSVCDHLAWAALRRSASIELVHVLDRREIDPVSKDLSGMLGLGEQESLLAEFAELDEQRHRLARRRGQLLLDFAARRLRDAGVNETESHQRLGTVVDVVSERAEGVAMIVLGRQGESAEHSGKQLGSNLERIARAVHTPLLVVPSTYRPIERVLIAFDGGQTIRNAIERLAETSFLAGMHAHLLTVGQPDYHQRQEQLLAATTLLERSGATVSSAIQSGDAEHVIVENISDTASDLLVMGAYGHSRIRELIIGSTTSSLLRSSPVPVLMYR